MDFIIVGVFVLLAVSYLANRIFRFFSGKTTACNSGCAGCVCSQCQEITCKNRKEIDDNTKMK